MLWAHETFDAEQMARRFRFGEQVSPALVTEARMKAVMDPFPRVLGWKVNSQTDRRKSAINVTVTWEYHELSGILKSDFELCNVLSVFFDAYPFFWFFLGEATRNHEFLGTWDQCMNLGPRSGTIAYIKVAHPMKLRFAHGFCGCFLPIFRLFPTRNVWDLLFLNQKLFGKFCVFFTFWNLSSCESHGDKEDMVPLWSLWELVSFGKALKQIGTKRTAKIPHAAELCATWT